MRVQVLSPSPTTDVVRVAGEIDACTTPLLAAALRSAIEHTGERVIVDLSDVTFLAVSGLSAMTRIRLLARQRNVDLVIDAIRSRQATRLLELAHIDFARPGIAATVCGGAGAGGSRAG
jgi:anti-sigma B factor antagonist